MFLVIIEIVYYFNFDDVVVLQDFVFCLVLMKGVEKGYCLWVMGKLCELLFGQLIVDVDVLFGDLCEVDVVFVGYL